MGFRPGQARAPWVGVAPLPPTPIPPSTTILTEGLPYDSVWFDATVIVPQETSGPSEQRLYIPTINKARNTLVFPTDLDTFAYIFWPEHVGYVDWADPQFRIRFFWTQIVATTSKTCVWGVAASNVYISDQESNAGFPFGTEGTFTAPENAIYDLNAGESGGEQNALSIPAPGGRAYEADPTAEINGITFRIARRGTNVSDTLEQSLYLYGVSIQFKTDFSNIAQWPST